jgi:hypothetical protein
MTEPQLPPWLTNEDASAPEPPRAKKRMGPPPAGYEARKDHPRRCTAKKSNGEPCTRMAITGGTVCPMHGGSTPQVRAKAAERIAEATILEQWHRLSRPAAELPQVNPVGALLAEIAWTSAFVEFLRQKLADLGQEDLFWGRVKVTRKDASMTPGVDVEEAAEVNVILRLLGTERDRLTRQIETAIKLDLDRRVVESHERMGQVIIGIIEATLSVMDITEQQRAIARGELHRQLTVVAAG